MKMHLYKKFIFVFILITSLLLISSSVLAQTSLDTPYFTYTGLFDYNWDSKTLTISITTISTIYYDDGTAAPNYSFPPFTVDDPLIGGTFTLGTLKNSAENTLVFGPDPGGSTGDVSFSLDSGGTNYLTANLNNFTVTNDAFGTRLNPGYDMDNVVDISKNPKVTNSKFLNEASSVGNLQMDFNIASGPQDFSANSSGTISGEYTIAPEPVSSVLFITGGALLARRRFIKRKR